jgi:hypothetical protein
VRADESVVRTRVLCGRECRAGVTAVRMSGGVWTVDESVVWTRVCCAGNRNNRSERTVDVGALIDDGGGLACRLWVAGHKSSAAECGLSAIWGT